MVESSKYPYTILSEGGKNVIQGVHYGADMLMKSLKCPHCGIQMKMISKFCPECGKPINQKRN
jgi:predicted amidophosphoribosyltransferase